MPKPAPASAECASIAACSAALFAVEAASETARMMSEARVSSSHVLITRSGAMPRLLPSASAVQARTKERRSARASAPASGRNGIGRCAVMAMSRFLLWDRSFADRSRCHPWRDDAANEAASRIFVLARRRHDRRRGARLDFGGDGWRGPWRPDRLCGH